MFIDDLNIKSYKFNNKTHLNIVKDKEQLNEWPLLYILNNDKKAYIGETTNIFKRTKQHYNNKDKRKLKNINLIYSNKFNKSVILDLENFLIEHMLADEKYELLNLNNGVRSHNYYQSEKYEEDFISIWRMLKDEGLVQEEDYKNLENKDIFRYSPYKKMKKEQYEVTDNILNNLLEDMEKNEKSTFLIQGGPGTGKSILAIYIMKRLNDLQREIELADDEYISISAMKLNKILKSKNKKKIKVALVIPMQSFRKTVQQVFKKVDGLQVNMVISPYKVRNSKEKYDILIVDESHRLSSRNTTKSKLHKEYYNKYGTQLDWIKSQSKYQIFFCDKGQTIRSADIGDEEFNCINQKKYMYELQSQFRCLAGEDYIKYIRDILSDNPPDKMINFNKENYEFYLFDDVNEMIEEIKEKANDKKYKLSRNLAGYAWPWNLGKKDIVIDKYKYIWNTTNIDFINSPNAINEIGCIHTSQGYDLNYAGIIIGNDIKYNNKTNKIYIDKANYYDKKGKELTNDAELKEFIINVYNVLLTRGINGTYVYVCDENLRNYLRKYIPNWNTRLKKIRYSEYKEVAEDDDNSYKVQRCNK